VGKAIKYTFAFCAEGAAGEKETFDQILNLEYFISFIFQLMHTLYTL
jgi:hypothetical protein